MANTSSSTKSSPAKRPAPAAAVAAARVKPATAAKKSVKPATAAVKAKPVAKPVKVAGARKAAVAKPVRAAKPAGVPPEQRRNYVEVAAYHIAERRGFAPGDPLQDWVLAEAEIDRLLAKGLLGG
ncbi:MAG: DUF2934 domain-containing protein [Betaproteobacteria bacterium]